MKKFATIFLLFIGLLFLSSCGFNNLSHIEDTNGDDNFELCSLTEKDLLSNRTHSLMEFAISGATSDGGYRFSSNKFSGVRDINSYVITKETSFKVDSEVTRGNALLYIYQDGKMIEKIDFGFDVLVKVTVTGKITLRVAGESANIDITIHKA